MRFVVLLGFTMIAARLGAFLPNQIGAIGIILIAALVFDLVDFIMNIIKTFKRK